MIVIWEACVVAVKFVVTLVALAVLVSIASAWASDIPVFAVLASISAKSVFANLSSVTWSSPIYAVFIVVPCQTPVPIVPTVVIFP